MFNLRGLEKLRVARGDMERLENKKSSQGERRNWSGGEQRGEISGRWAELL